MFQLTSSNSNRRGGLLALLLIVFSASALAQAPSGPPQPPWGPETAANGTYTVNWLRQGTTTYLQERIGSAGTWANVSSSLYQSSGNSYSITYTGKASGDYFYRLNVAFTNQYGTSWYNSNEIRVTVYSGPVPTQDLVSNQMRYSYETRIGDINSDGRQDVYVNRTAGGLALNGTLGNIILQQNADKSFTPIVPTAGQASTAAGWAASSTPLELDDLNLDGYVDIRLPDLGSVISGVFGQIVFSSGRISIAAPQKVTAINAKVSKFLADTQLWIDEPHYFPSHASIIQVPVYVEQVYCDYVWQGDYYSYECWSEWVFIGYQAYYDFSPWDADAVKMRYSISQSTSGEVQPTVVPGSTEAGDIDRWFRNVFGVDLARGILTIGNCTSANSYVYDSDVSMPCLEIGIHVLQTVHIDKGPCRSLAPGEIAQTTFENVHIFNPLAAKVCRRAYMKSWVPSWLKSDVMAPNGNIYIDPNSTWMPWYEDYSFASTELAGVFQHELVHVFQTRNGGCWKYCMLRNKIQSVLTGGYRYWPLVSGKPFDDYNIEQQAEMVSDRFRLSRGLPLPEYDNGVINQGSNLGALVSFVPVLQGFMKLH